MRLFRRVWCTIPFLVPCAGRAGLLLWVLFLSWMDCPLSRFRVVFLRRVRVCSGGPGLPFTLCPCCPWLSSVVLFMYWGPFVLSSFAFPWICMLTCSSAALVPVLRSPFCFYSVLWLWTVGVVLRDDFTRGSRLRRGVALGV